LKSSYLQDERPANPSAKAGFDSSSLPSFPAAAETDSSSSGTAEPDGSSDEES